MGLEALCPSRGGVRGRAALPPPIGAYSLFGGPCEGPQQAFAGGSLYEYNNSMLVFWGVAPIVETPGASRDRNWLINRPHPSLSSFSAASGWLLMLVRGQFPGEKALQQVLFRYLDAL